jgi:hypothetical protein
MTFIEETTFSNELDEKLPPIICWKVEVAIDINDVEPELVSAL